MNDMSFAKFILSHNSQSGYDYGECFNKIIKDMQTQNWIKSYIEMITDYASDSRYMSNDFKCISYFVKENYLTIVKSYPKKDDRLFLESEVSIVDVSQCKINFAALKRESNLSITVFDDGFISNLNCAILTTLLSENTTLYCISNNNNILATFYESLYSFDKRILLRNSCTEAIGDIPKVNSSIVICRCLISDDYNRFKRKIENDPNCIIIDFMDEPTIKFRISCPSFAQACLNTLVNQYGWESWYYSLLETMDKNEKRVSFSKRAYFNAMSFFCLRANYPSEVRRLTISTEEKDELNSLLC